MRRLCTVLILICGLAALGQSADEFYVRIYNTIQEADTLAANLQYGPALEKYEQARTALERFQKGNPQWNAAIVRFRLAYLEERIAQISPKAPAPAPPQPVQQQQQQLPAGPGVAPALEAQLNALQEQVRVLQADRNKLEAKLKEALSVQPATVDPRELAKAEQRIQALQKENELLKVAAEQSKARVPQVPAGQTDALADLNRRLTEQTERVKTLEIEKRALRDRLQAADSQTLSEDSKAALDRATHNITEQQEMIQRLTAEREALQARLKALGADAESAAALKTENELLKKQLAEAKARLGSPAQTPGTGRVSELEAQVAALKSDKEMLLLEKQALQGAVKQLQAKTNGVLASTAPPPPPTREETKRIRELEKERDALLKKLATANRELADRKGGGSGRVGELQHELASIRQKLGVLEAEKVPYTEEELALFRAPEPTLATAAASTSPPPRKFSATTAGMAAEAQRHFAAGRLEEAEQQFQQVLKEDNSDVVTLANLATVQIARKEYDEAERNIRKALEIAPQDAFSVSLLGRLRFQQGKNDEAFEALSRAAALDPKSAEIQNYLGLVLSEKGMRVPAETALRKAIQLQPNYGSAHQNLAVVYLSQNPPLVELARYHYGKSLGAGAPANPELERMIEAKKGRK